MKLAKWILLSAIVFAFNVSDAQTTKQQKQQAKADDIKNMINNQNFVFIAQYVNPLRGGHRYLNYDYDFKVKKDSLIAYLPYFGRVTFDPPVYPTDDGIKFTSTNYGYSATQNKKGNWEIVFTPKDVKYQREVRLTVGSSGSATLFVNSTNRDAISYDGYIDKIKTKTK